MILALYLGYIILVGKSSNCLLLSLGLFFPWNIPSCFNLTPADKSFKTWPTGNFLSSFYHWLFTLSLSQMTFSWPPTSMTNNQLAQSATFCLSEPTLPTLWPPTSLLSPPITLLFLNCTVCSHSNPFWSSAKVSSSEGPLWYFSSSFPSFLLSTEQCLHLLFPPIVV